MKKRGASQTDRKTDENRQKRDPINILVTVDANYLRHVSTLLTSLHVSNPADKVRLYLVHADIPDERLEELDGLCGHYGVTFLPVRVGNDAFAEAPVTAYYSKAMYYRLLASKILPDNLDKVLYLDPDILVINSLNQLYEIELGDRLFAAAAHTGLTDLSKHVNRIRLGTYESEGYFNSGVLLLNLVEQRKRIHERDIFAFVKENGDELLLPDQDILNVMFGTEILAQDDSLYNYDSRRYTTYYLKSDGLKDMDWVMRNTVIIHYCGKIKPWRKKADGKFDMLYKHYARLAEKNLTNK